MQKKSFRFNKNVCVGKNLNLGICSKFGGNFEGFWEILRKYCILDGRPFGSIGLRLKELKGLERERYIIVKVIERSSLQDLT